MSIIENNSSSSSKGVTFDPSSIPSKNIISMGITNKEDGTSHLEFKVSSFVTKFLEFNSYEPQHTTKTPPSVIFHEVKITNLSKCATDIDKFVQDMREKIDGPDEFKPRAPYVIDAKEILPKSNTTDAKKNNFKIRNKWEVIDQDKLKEEINELKKAGIEISYAELITRYTTIDKSTNHRYLNDSKWVVRAKCLALVPGTLLVQPILLIVNIVDAVYE